MTVSLSFGCSPDRLFYFDAFSCCLLFFPPLASPRPAPPRPWVARRAALRGVRADAERGPVQGLQARQEARAPAARHARRGQPLRRDPGEKRNPTENREKQRTASSACLAPSFPCHPPHASLVFSALLCSSLLHLCSALRAPPLPSSPRLRAAWPGRLWRTFTTRARRAAWAWTARGRW